MKMMTKCNIWKEQIGVCEQKHILCIYWKQFLGDIQHFPPATVQEDAAPTAGRARQRTLIT